MPRSICNHCHFPARTCVCHLIQATEQIHYPGEIHVLQHPSEYLHAKNTVRLLTSVMQGVTVWQGETDEDFTVLRARVQEAQHNWACFFPGPTSIECSQQSPLLPKTSLIFIDATWRKARKIWHLNPWLQELDCFHLSTRLQGNYVIRKNHFPHQLSTLEAIAHATAHCCNSEVLLSLFENFQNHSQQFFEAKKKQ